jgi:hypothetical protein
LNKYPPVKVTMTSFEVGCTATLLCIELFVCKSYNVEPMCVLITWENELEPIIRFKRRNKNFFITWILNYKVKIVFSKNILDSKNRIIPAFFL